ncbi:hypothetical protein [Haloarchaeobius sp. DFWS5]|uniref:hypothetical protein n=1 Tax=Haloarchaeobius sp. DFWS5 TaxID=3446114 RepID=UPI003EB7A88E
MAEHSDDERLDFDSVDDPRVNPDHVRVVPETDTDGQVALLGVVHDHPASVHRVQYVIERFVPDVVALELAPLAIPLFERYATDDRTPPSRGGEMSAAIQAMGPDASVVGIDAPTRSFLRTVVGELRDEEAPEPIARRVARDVYDLSRHALQCRVAATAGPMGLVSMEQTVQHIDHDCSATDPPAVQADDEQRFVARNRALRQATETPLPISVLDTAREKTMARHLSSLRTDHGAVVAVVGLEHLDAVAARLRAGDC